MSTSWQSTIFSTANEKRNIESPQHIIVTGPPRLRMGAGSKASLDDDIERGNLPDNTIPTVLSGLPISPEITPTPNKRWSVNTAEATSPTRSKQSDEIPTFRFGLPSASASQEALAEYPFNAQPCDMAGDMENQLSDDYSPSVARQEKDEYLGTAGRNTLRLPSKRTFRRYVSVLFGCMLILTTLALFPSLTEMGELSRRSEHYTPTLAKRDIAMAAGTHHDQAALARGHARSGHAGRGRERSEAESEQERYEGEARKGSGWAWRPQIDEQDNGLYILDELEEDESAVHFTPSRSEEEYEEIERQISQKNVFSSLTSVQARRSRGRPEARLEGLKSSEILALRQLEERNRISSLRALVAFIDAGSEFPASWIDEGPQGKSLLAAIEKAWTDVDGNGLEGALKKLVGKRAASETFPRGWKAGLEEAIKLVIFTKSYCPYSRQLKRILSDYHIEPAPFYVDIDRRDDAMIIQTLLQEFTSRSAIPVVLLNSHPIGGADELQLAASEGSMPRIFEREGLYAAKKYH